MRFDGVSKVYVLITDLYME